MLTYLRENRFGYRENLQSHRKVQDTKKLLYEMAKTNPKSKLEQFELGLRENRSAVSSNLHHCIEHRKLRNEQKILRKKNLELQRKIQTPVHKFSGVVCEFRVFQEKVE